MKPLIDTIREPLLNISSVPIQTKHDETLFFTASSIGDLEVMKNLYKRGMNPNRPHFIHAATALHMAAERGHSHIVEWLLGLPTIKVNPKKIDKSITPLYLAAYYNRKEIVTLLLAHSDIDIHAHSSTPPYPTAIVAASHQGANDCVVQLAQNHSVNLEAPFRVATKNKQEKVVDTLLTVYLNRMLDIGPVELNRLAAVVTISQYPL